MTATAEDLDFGVEAMEPDGEELASLEGMAPDEERPGRREWHERRRIAFGGSDLGALYLVLGIRQPSESDPDWLIDKAKPVRVGSRKRKNLRAVPRLFAEKGGLRKERKDNDTSKAGREREIELLTQWRRHLESGSFRDEREELIIPASIRHVSAIPEEWLPLVDRHCPRLAVSIDGWARDVFGTLIDVSAKCSVNEKPTLPWYNALQSQGVISATSAPYGVVVLGEQWGAGWKADGPIRAWFVDRDDDEIARIHAAVEEGWARVDALRKEMA